MRVRRSYNPVVIIIRLYRILLSPLLPASCRFTPTCSSYAEEAIEKYGIARGGWLSIMRISKCHPFNKGGFDPVPDKWEDRKRK